MSRKASVIFSVLLTFCLTSSFPAPLFADYVFNADLGKFVKADKEFYENDQEQYDHAVALAEEEDYAGAEEAFHFVYRKFPQSTLAQQAIIKTGEMQEKQAKYNTAFTTYQLIIDNYPQSPYTNEILDRQYKIGNMFLSGKKGKIMNVPILPSLGEAVKVFSKLNENAPFAEHGVKAQYQLAMTYKKKRATGDAIAAFQKFIDNYPTSDLVPEAYFQLAEISYQRSMRRNNDRKLFKQARETLNDFLRRYPKTADTDRIQQYLLNLDDRDAESIYTIAKYYEDTSYFESAIVYYKDLVELYPESKWASKAQKRLGSFEDPEKFLLEGQKVLDSRLMKLEKEHALLAVTQTPVEHDKRLELERLIEEAKLDIKRLGKEKKKEIRIRWESLRRKKWELADKKKKLKLKEKALLKNPSDDLDAAIARWRDSIEAEDYALKMEERELLGLEKKLGIRRLFAVGKLFKKSALGFGDIAHYKASAVEELNEDFAEVEKEKSDLYDALEGYERELADLEAEQDGLCDALNPNVKGFDSQQAALEQERAELDALKMRLNKKKDELSETEGIVSKMVGIPSKSVSGILRPFKKASHTKVSKFEMTRNQVADLKEEIEIEESQIARLKSLLNDLKKTEVSVDAAQETAAQETGDRRVPQERIDKRKIRKQVMSLEKKINKAHQIVEDGYAKKATLLEQLDTEVTDIDNEKTLMIVRPLKVVAAPFVSFYRGFGAFLFGLKDIEGEVAEKTARVEKKADDVASQERIGRIKKKIRAIEQEIARAELSIVGFEVDLETLVASIKGELAAKKRYAVRTSQTQISADIEERSAYVGTLKSELAKSEGMLQSLQADGVTPSEETRVVTEEKELTAKETVRSLKADVRALQEAYAAKKKRVSAKQKALHDERKAILRKTARKTVAAKDAKLQKKIDARIDERNDVIADILEQITEQDAILAARREIVQAKLSRVKKHVGVMEQYQDTQLAEMQELQKNVYKELDEVNSACDLLAKERTELAGK